MYYIALQMLLNDRAKFFAMVVGITFAAQMMTQQPAIFVGLLSRSYSFIDDVSEPDIWVMSQGTKFVEENKPLRDIELLKIRGISGIKWATPLYKSMARAKLPDGSRSSIDLTGIDDATLTGAPHRIISGSIEDFRRPNAIFVDINAAETRLRVSDGKGGTRPLRVGDILELNDKRAIIVGLMKSTRNFILQPQIFTTYSNALNYSPPGRKQLGYVLVKAKDGVDHAELAAKISQVTGLLAEPTAEFKDRNLSYWMNNTGIPINFGITVLLGFIVGAAITGQTFYGFILENLKHYAVLKAMGVTNGMLTRIVLLQAFCVGFIGYGIGVGLTSLFGMNFQDSVLAFRMPPVLLLFAGAGVFIIISLSALMGARKVTSVDPSSVFRG